MKDKRKLVIIIFAAILLVAGAGSYLIYRSSHRLCYDTMDGGCLPAGQCAAPNDAIVDCEKLRQNPTKTDWTGGE